MTEEELDEVLSDQVFSQWCLHLNTPRFVWQTARDLLRVHIRSKPPSPPANEADTTREQRAYTELVKLSVAATRIAQSMQWQHKLAHGSPREIATHRYLMATDFSCMIAAALEEVEGDGIQDR